MQIVTFRAAGATLGIPILAVEEFFRPVAVTPVPLSDPRIAGLMNIRGKSCTVIDLRSCLHRPTAPPSKSPKMILLETNDRLGGRLAGQENGHTVRTSDEPVVLLVDRILDIATIPPAQILHRPAHVTERFVAGICRWNGDYVSLLDLQPLFEDIRTRNA
jgi:chemotaxis signal transduction protein